MTTQKVRDAVGCQQEWVGEFGQFYRDMIGLVIAVAMRLLRRNGLAEEVAQEAISRTWNRRAKLKSRTHARNSVCRIARNLCNDILRSATTRKERSLAGLDPDDPRYAVNPSAQVLDADSRDIIRAALTKLPKKDRVILRLRYEFEMTPEEVAERLEMTVGAVNAAVYRARKRLRELLVPDFPELAPAANDAE